MAISAGRRETEALSDLALRVVDALRSPGVETSTEDPFTLALKRYQSAGSPAGTGGKWREALSDRAEPPASSTSVLRKLDRDLLSSVVRYAVGPAPVEPEEAQLGSAEGMSPASPVRVIGEPESLPSLSLGSDGTWHADEPRAPGAASLLGRLSTLSGGGSRYPTPETVAARRRPLLDRIGPQAAASAVAARVQTPAPPPAFFPPRPTEPVPVEESPASAKNDDFLSTVSGGVELVVGPFSRLQHLAAFTRALQEMPGVADVSARQFERGLVHIRVRYADAVPLTNRLAQLREFSPTVVSATKTRIELKVEPPDHAPATP